MAVRVYSTSYKPVHCCICKYYAAINSPCFKVFLCISNIQVRLLILLNLHRISQLWKVQVFQQTSLITLKGLTRMRMRKRFEL